MSRPVSRFLSPTLALLALGPALGAAEEDAPKADISQAELDTLHRQLGEQAVELRRLREGEAPPPAAETGAAATLGAILPDYTPDDDEIVVTASRRATSRLRAPFSLDVVEARDIERQGRPTALRRQLRYVAGTHFTQNGSVGGTTTLSLRGSPGYDTRFLLDGIPLSDPSTTQGQIDMAAFNTAGVERIEVLKGAQGGVYGSRAVGGVVNLTTLRPTAERKTGLSAETGSMNTQTVSLRATGPLPLLADVGYALAVTAYTSDGISSRYDQPVAFTSLPSYSDNPFYTWYRNRQEETLYYGQRFRLVDGTWVPRYHQVPPGDPDGREEDGFQRLTMNGRLEYTPSDTFSCYLAGYGVLSHSEFDGYHPYGGVQPDDDESSQKAQQWRASAGFEWQAASWLTLATDGAHGQLNRQYPHVDRLNRTRNYDSRESYATARAILSPREDVTLTLGGDWHREAADFANGNGRGDVVFLADHLLNPGNWYTWQWYPTTPFFELTGTYPSHAQYAFLQARQASPLQTLRHATGAWAELTLSGDDYEVVAAGRHDWHSAGEDAMTGRLAGAWFLADKRIKLRASLASGMRLPSLYELYSPYGNEGLEPQESVSTEAGLDLRPWPGVTIKQTAFRTEYTNRIEFYSAYTPGSQPASSLTSRSGYRNLDREAWIKGYEGELVIEPEGRCWQLQLGYTELDSHSQREDGSDRPLTNVPDHILTGSATVEHRGVWLTMGARRVGKRTGSIWGDTAVPIPGTGGLSYYFEEEYEAYTVVHGAVGWQALSGLELWVRGENLLDEDYEEVDGYTTVRPSVFGGLEYTF